MQMCYPGQNFDMSVPTSADVAEDDLLGLAERFHDQHERERGFCFRNQQPLIRGVRLVARVTTPKPDRFAALGHGHRRRAGAHGSPAGVLRRRVRRHARLRRPAARPRRRDRRAGAGRRSRSRSSSSRRAPRLTLDPTGNYELHL